MTAAAQTQRRTGRTTVAAMAPGWWSRPDRSTCGLAALLGGLPLGAFVEGLGDDPPAPGATASTVAAVAALA
jgi:hypothetical protein